SNNDIQVEKTHDKDFTQQKQIGKTGLLLKTYVPFDYVRQNIFEISKEVLAIGFAVILLSIIVIVFVTNLLTRRIYIFKRKMELIRDNRTELLYNLGGSDEIAELDSGLNEMVDRLRKLISDLYRAEAQKKDAELKYLQTQINPHFLYNTLDSIKSCVDLEQNDNAVKMLIALKNYFRTGLNRGNDVISVQDEIKHASAYIDIQKFRSDNLFEVEWDVEQDVEKCYIMKTILQPIIENSILHGLYERGDNGKIKVRIKRYNNYLYICVFDNGIGVSPAELKSIRNALNEHSEKLGVGMKNVKNRLYNYYNGGCDFKVYSVQNKGFYTVMKIEMARIDN
ncbi:MAG: sensor histidine kinase, partial [Oscillospiraceae bacterium]|nr:sensor histidine kinase [Oscillospiraceae bacterium]